MKYTIDMNQLNQYLELNLVNQYIHAVKMKRKSTMDWREIF